MQIAKNLQIEWERALQMDRTLLTSEVSRRKNELEEDLLNVFHLFVRRCKIKASEIINDLPQLSQVRRDYNSKLNSFNETLRAHVLNESDSTRMTLAQLERDKDYLRIYHNELLINHNSRILELQLGLDNFKQGIVSEQNDMIFFYKKINDIRSLYTFPGETLEQKLARDKEFNSWKEMLKLPSNWFEEVATRQEIVPPSSSEREFNVPSPDLSGINIPSPSRLDQINIPSQSVQQLSYAPSPTFTERSASPELATNIPSSSVQQLSYAPSPTFTERSASPELATNIPSPSVQRSPNVPSPTFTQGSESSPLGVDAFRPRSTIGDTPLHRKHIDNENLLRRIKKSYWKARNEIEFYVRSGSIF
uniref:BVpp69a protein n=1 Tax=Chelonus inanitus TaxID=49201 RepID=D7FB25_9HYME|nr:BVpp69a protein [Chelonus inanitus]